MSPLFIAILVGIISLALLLYMFDAFRKPEASLKINFIDYKEINFYSEITLEINHKVLKKMRIKGKSATINIYGIKNMETVKAKLILKNPTKKEEKKFIINIYKNVTNILNININNRNGVYYDSEFIFYFKNQDQNIKADGLEYSNHNQKYRQRLLLYNSNKDILDEILRKNNINQKKSLGIVEKNNNKLLLLNIYVDINKVKTYIFIEGEKSLIVPNQEEKKLFQNFYETMYTNMLDTHALIQNCESYKNKIIKKAKIFGQKINNLNDDKDNNILFSLINQGLNCLFNNNILSKNNINDFHFIAGYILFYYYIDQKTITSNLVTTFFEYINKAYQKNYSISDLMRIGISYILFAKNKLNNLKLRFTDELKKDNPYRNGFEFFENIVKDLDEDSDLIFIYLQINSGYGLELINNEICFKLSMIPVKTVQDHILELIPKYFYIYESNKEIYGSSDSRTQVTAFNDNKIIDQSNNYHKNNSLMNVTIEMLHESGHTKFHMNNDVGGDRSPKACINKSFELIKKSHWTNQGRGESGKFIDYFLYNTENDDELPINIISSGKSNELMDKKYFTGNLDILNMKANQIASTLSRKNTQIKSQDSISNINNLGSGNYQSNKKESDEKEYKGSRISDIDF